MCVCVCVCVYMRLFIYVFLSFFVCVSSCLYEDLCMQPRKCIQYEIQINIVLLGTDKKLITQKMTSLKI